MTNFNSRPCGRGDNGKKPAAETGRISIHAPAGGATKIAHTVQKFLDISIHAPAGGATRQDRERGRRKNYFNSRPCGRGDGLQGVQAILQALISIHAPAGGATGRWAD